MEQMIKPIIYWAKYNNFKQFYSFKSTDMMLAFQTHLSQLALISWANILFVLGQTQQYKYKYREYSSLI